MAYRLICVYETRDSLTPEIRVEVNLEGRTASLAPFLRKVSLDDLYKEGVTENENILYLLNHAGFQHQPFRINPKLLTISSVRMILKKHSRNYFQFQGKGSAKKIACPLKNLPTNDMISVGTLLCGELYINNLNDWKHKIDVRVRYADALSSFYPVYSSIPYLTHANSLFERDNDKEKTLLEMLGDGYDWKTATLTLSDYDTDFIKQLVERGWKVYVTNQSRSHTAVYVHSEPSGIVWFSTEETPESNFSQQLLDGFLHSRNYHVFNGNILLFRKNDVEKVDDETIVENIVKSPSDVNSLYLNNVSLSEEEKRKIDKLLKLSFKASLRDYQKDGVLWLQERRKNHQGCLLADEMGLGKTVQIIAHLCCVDAATNKHLIILPTSLVYNWQNEVQTFAPQLMKQLTFVSYDMLRIHINDYINHEYDTIIIDEAQIIKNRQAQKYQAIRKLKCKHKIILTGTPIENTIDELWSHFIVLIPEMKVLYDSLRSMGIPTSKEIYIGLTSKLLKPFILRRNKEQVLSDLPEKTEKTIYIELSDSERAIYQRIHHAILQALVTGVSGRVSSIAIEGLLRLRQACVSANLLPQDLNTNSLPESSKLKIAVNYILKFKSEGRKVLVFSQFVSALNEMEKLLDKSNIQYVVLYGDTRNRDVQVKKFQNDKSITVFLISLKAGGVGLNLTSADRVIMLDDWWNPAVEDQAMARSHRIGQKNNVLVLRLVCKDTVEEKILQLQNKKRQTISMFNSSNDKLTIEDIRLLLG